MADLLTRMTRGRLTGPITKAAGIPRSPDLIRAAADGSVGAIGPILTSSSPRVDDAVAALGFARAGEDESRIGGVLFDATSMEDPVGLDQAYRFFRPAMARLSPCAKLVVLGPGGKGQGPTAAASVAALGGFVRSLAKEVGRKGATANLLLVEPGAEARLAEPLRFFLTPRSAYVSGQTVSVSSRVGDGVAGTPPRALVTGAARGLGAATARRLAAGGAKVVCLDVPAAQQHLDAVVEEIGAEAVALDITAPDAAASLSAPDLLVHNAGVTRDKTLRNITPDMWDLVMDVNLRAVLRLDQALLPAMRAGGRAIYLSSINGIAGSVGQTNYAATKAALIGYVQAQAPLLAPRGITANAVAPGFIDTAMTAQMPAVRRTIAGRANSLLQPGRPEDVAEAIALLTAPGAHGLTGQTLRVCGQNMVGA